MKSNPKHEEFAPGVVRVPVMFANAYLVDVAAGEPGGGWFLLDTGLPGVGAGDIRRAASQRYGAGQAPRAIVLTHGHFDHAGSAGALADHWRVPVYAHVLELPYLTNRSDYPPPDPTVGGALAMMARTFPYRRMNLGAHMRPLPMEETPAFLAGWRVLHTPGHTPGHVALWRESDRTLLAGDALSTVNLESWGTAMSMPRELRWPPAALTTDWTAAHASVLGLAGLRPHTLAAGHGQPMAGEQVAPMLETFAREFRRPTRGRYVRQAAQADENGVVSVPPPIRDHVGSTMKIVAGSAAVGAVLLAIDRLKPRR